MGVVMTNEFVPYDDNLEQQQTCARAFYTALLLCLFGAFCFAGVYYARASCVCELSIETTVNPNYAPVASLVRLPGVGPKRARAIVDFRKDALEDVFNSARDMEQVTGIGPKTAEKIAPYLDFD